MGKPKIIPNHVCVDENEEVKLKCGTNGLVNSNPHCKTFIWRMINNQDGSFPRVVQGSNWLQFRMEQKYEGKYECYCENDYGKSKVSDIAVIFLLNATSASKFQVKFSI